MNIRQRLDALESAKPVDKKLMFLIFRAPGEPESEITAATIEGVRYDRQPGESIDQFEGRLPRTGFLTVAHAHHD